MGTFLNILLFFGKHSNHGPVYRRSSLNSRHIVCLCDNLIASPSILMMSDKTFYCEPYNSTENQTHFDSDHHATTPHTVHIALENFVIQSSRQSRVTSNIYHSSRICFFLFSPKLKISRYITIIY